MTIKEYAKVIARLAKKYPDAKVIYSVDDEGNAFNEVEYSPTPGRFARTGEFGSHVEPVNAICIN